MYVYIKINKNHALECTFKGKSLKMILGYGLLVIGYGLLVLGYELWVVKVLFYQNNIRGDSLQNSFLGPVA